MKRIWIINQAALSPRDSGGTRHFSLARVLAAHGFAPTIISEAGRHTPGLETIDGVQFLRLDVSSSKKSRWHRLSGMLVFSRALLQPLPLDKPDLILGSSPPLFAVVAAQKLAKRLGVPFVLEIRDFWPESLVQIAGISPLHPMVLLMRQLAKRLYKKADHIVTLFPESLEYFAQHGVERERITVIPNGIDPALIETPAARPSAEGFHLYYLGALGIPNAMEPVVEAAKLLQQRGRNITFHLVGDGVRKAALQAQAVSLRNVIFEAPVSKQQVASVLARADGFLISVLDRPLYRWGFSANKLFDYLYAARPILFAGGIEPGFIAQHRAGIYCAANPAAIADAAEQLAALPVTERQAMGERGRAYVLAYHDMGKLGAQLAAALEKL